MDTFSVFSYPFFKFRHRCYAIGDDGFIVFHTVIVFTLRCFKFQSQNQVFLLLCHYFHNSFCHSLEVTIVFSSFLNVDNVKLPYFPIVGLVKHMPCNAVFIGVQTIDAPDFSYSQVCCNLSRDCKTAVCCDWGVIVLG